jgi:hypothetical protein
MECVIVRQAGRAVTVRQILMNVLFGPQLPSINAKKNSSYKFKMDLTSVCVMMDTSDLETFVLVSQIILMDLSFRFRFMVFNTTFNNISVILWLFWGGRGNWTKHLTMGETKTYNFA